MQAHADELAVDLHVLDAPVGLEERAKSGLIDAGHEKVLVAVGMPSSSSRTAPPTT